MTESINRIKDYFVSMAMYEGKWVMAVRYPPKWVAYSSDDNSIIASKDDQNNDVWWYYAKDENIDVDNIINLVTETVQTNFEAIKKVELFKLKAGELKKLFSDETIGLKQLESLRFIFDKQTETTDASEPVSKDKPKKTVQTKKDVMMQVGEKIQGHDVFQAETTTEATETAPVVQEDRKQKRRAQKQNTEEIKALKPATPEELTQSDIEALRG